MDETHCPTVSVRFDRRQRQREVLPVRIARLYAALLCSVCMLPVATCRAQAPDITDAGSDARKTDGIPMSRIQRDFEFADEDGDGKLSFEEYLVLPSSASLPERSAIPDPFVERAAHVRAGFEEAWSGWDENSDGVLTDDEFTEAKISERPDVPVGLVFEDWDRDRNGQLSQAEALLTLDVAYGIRCPEDELLRTASGAVINWAEFKRLDQGLAEKPESDGIISGDEFVRHWNADVSKEMKQKTFGQLDTSTDGVLTFNEWSDVGTWPVYGSRFIDPRDSFLAWDEDFDGKLSREELLKGTPQRDLAIARHLFPGFDLDGDGFLSFWEFRDTPAQNPVYDWHRDLRDTDNDGVLSLAEFRTAPTPLLAGVFQRYFQRYDANDDGVLSQDEMSFISSFRDPKAEFRRADRDADGTLSLTEYISIRTDEDR